MQANRPKLQTRLQSFTDWYSKAVIGLTLGAVAALRLAGVPLLGTAGQAGALYRAMGMLTAAAPCALVIAPLSYIAAMAALYQK
jgi:cation transport ATPase